MSAVRPGGSGEADAGRVFAALGDPTRRRLLATLAREPGATASRLAADLPISRQAVAKHLAALTAAELVEPRREGRETRYRLTPEPLEGARAWMAEVEARWDGSLTRLAARAREAPCPPPGRGG